MAESIPKYPHSLENITNREYKIFSTVLDIATNIGKLSVLEGVKKNEILNTNDRLIKILNALVAKNTVNKTKKVKSCKTT